MHVVDPVASCSIMSTNAPPIYNDAYCTCSVVSGCPIGLGYSDWDLPYTKMMITLSGSDSNLRVTNTIEVHFIIVIAALGFNNTIV